MLHLGVRSDGIDRCGLDLCDWLRNYLFLLYLFTLNNLSLVLSLAAFSVIWPSGNIAIRRWSRLSAVGNLILNRICGKKTKLVFWSDGKISLYLRSGAFCWRHYTWSHLFFLLFLLIVSFGRFSWYRKLQLIILFFWYSCNIVFWLNWGAFRMFCWR
jgi:hypothetical protein